MTLRISPFVTIYDFGFNEFIVSFKYESSNELILVTFYIFYVPQNYIVQVVVLCCFSFQRVTYSPYIYCHTVKVLPCCSFFP